MTNFDLDGLYCGPEAHDTIDRSNQSIYDGLWQLEDDLADWGEMTFTEATLESITVHLRREQAELAEASSDDVAGELADCWILLNHLRRKIDRLEADLVSHSIEDGIDLADAVRAKFALNRGRTWGEPDEEGVVEHVEERRCRVCGCTDMNCSQCVERTGSPCYWVAEDLCSACVQEGTL